MNTTIWTVLISLVAAGFALHTIGKGLIRVLEWAAVIAAVFGALWFTAKGLYQAGRWLVLHWRTTTATVAVGVGCWLLGWRWVATGTSWAVELIGVWWLVAWRIGALPFFDHWAGRHLRGWWQRWAIYAPRMPNWLRACRLSVPDSGQGVTVIVNPFRRTGIAPEGQAPP